MANYQTWNVAIVNHFFREERFGQRAVLSADAETLRQCMMTQLGEDDFDSDEDAVSDFADAIQEEFRQRQHRCGLLNETLATEKPDYVAFLAAQVLAAFSVGDLVADSDSGDSFWNSFQELFGDAVSPSSQFYADQVVAWNDLALWANVRNSRRLGSFEFPEIHRGQGKRWFVNLPYSQCLLRTSDLARLDAMFAAFHLTPHDAANHNRIEQIVRGNRHDQRWFTRQAQRVLQSTERFRGAINQIIGHLREWDGHVHLRTAAAQCSGRDIELAFDIHARSARLTFRLFDVENEEATHALAISDVETLFSIASLKKITIDGVTFRPRAKHHLLAVEHPAINRFLTANRVRPDERFRLAVHIREQRNWMKDIDRVCVTKSIRRFCSAQRNEPGMTGLLQGLPADWLLIEGLVRADLNSIPDTWNSIIDERSPRISAVGGLKLDRHAWQSQAGPRILVCGSNLPSSLLIDGFDVPISPFGWVTNSVLDTPGCHIVSLANGERRCRGLRIQVREATLSPPLAEYPGWRSAVGEWPSQALVSPPDQSAYVAGMNVCGAWDTSDKKAAAGPLVVAETAARSMIRLLLSKRGTVETNVAYLAHPLVKLLATRSSSRVSAASAARQSKVRGDK